jgi:hypothetical protein
MAVYPILVFVAALGGFLLGVSGLSGPLEDPGWFAAILIFVLFTMATAGAAFILAARWWFGRERSFSRQEALRWWLRHRHVFMGREV